LGTRVKQAPAGYTTALIGKWHIEGATPYNMGFDYYELANYNSPTDHQSVTAKTNAAISFMSDAVANNNPFFVMISQNALHRPIDPNLDTLAKYEALEPGTRHTSAAYAAYTEDLDRGVGLLLDSLENLGIDENTYVIYTSDNGPEKSDSPSTPLYMAKKSLFEGGLRMPFVVSGPGIEANSVSRVPVTTVDVYSTISSLVGTEGPLPAGVEGASLTPLFFNGGAFPGDMPHLERTHAEDGAIFFMQPANIATGPVYRLRPAAAVRRGDYKLVRFFGENGGDDIDMLFNLADYSVPFTETEFLNDPLDLSDDFPELTQELGQLLESWFDSADVSLPFDVSAPTEIAWSAEHQGDLAQVWRSVTDVDQKYRESWYLPGTSANAPELTAATAFQPGLSDTAFRFDGNDRASRQFFYVSDDLPRISNKRFPTGTADFDRSVSFEFWV
jgi:arylsulfatase A-like enzyme